MNRARRIFKYLKRAWFGPWDASAHFSVLLPAALCFALIWPFGGGWKTVNLMAGAGAPAAQGLVKYKTGGNGNVELQIDTRSLAPPDSLMPPENVYVVWIEPPGRSAQNLGRLKINGKEQADLSAETPFKRFHVFITAEHNQQIQAPEGPTVLSADVSL